jgi:pimeloyl-ACP methyl ester carboxylesterase
MLASLVCLCCLTLVPGAGLRAQQVPAAVTSDPAPDKANPPTMEAPDILSYGSMLHAVLYIASGAGAHPTVVLLHGFPGNEKNLDLAYSVRRAGWNVLIPHYRGAWGSQGTFSFANALDDTQAAVNFLRAPENAAKYHIDPRRIVLIGHSMGGFMACLTAAHDAQITAVGMISPWNVGPSVASDMKGRSALFDEASTRLAGTTPEGMIAEARRNAAKWNYVDYALALKDRPVLMVEADDGTLTSSREMAAALRKTGNTRLTEEHMATDHGYSDHRIALQSVVVEWLQGLAGGSGK